MEFHRVKLAFTGTSCTGKTTLVRRWANDPSVTIVPEAARQYFATHDVDPATRFSALVQAEIQKLAIRGEEVAERSDKAVILCDRSALDAVVYTDFSGDRGGAAMLYRVAEPFVPTYSKIFVLDPRDVPYRRDSIRIEDESTRQLLHDRFLAFLHQKGIGYELLSGTIDERASRVGRLVNPGQFCD